ncbi:hypothetical protein [Shewanella algae]|uniref:hypothetical protein n=1 Tax=Shewanella algae TaxID=38313 RepID=UPI0030058CC8
MTLTPFNSYNTVLPSAFLFSPIFAPIKFDNRKGKVFFRSERTKDESLTYFGYTLDCEIDLKLYALIINKSFDTKNYSITIARNEIFDALKTSPNDRHCSKFKSYVKRIERFKSCNFVLESADNNIDLKEINIADFIIKRRQYSLIHDYFVSPDNKSIQIYLKYRFKNDYMSKFNMQLLNLNDLSKFKTKYDKAIFLMFLTKTFKNHNYFFIDKNKLHAKIGNNISKKRANEIIINTLKNFIELKLISKFEDYSSNSFKIFTNK